MLERIKRLWRGELPLARAFWNFAIFYGLVLNLVTHIAFLTLLLNEGNATLVALAMVFPIPYNLLVVVAVWRSAGRYSGPKKWADLARIGTVIWMLALTLT